jgi:hypothetical protein
MSWHSLCIGAAKINALSDEDTEQDPDRWCSHTAWGQECWRIVAQWVWNLRLELGHRLHPDPVRTTEFAPAQPAGQAPVADSASPVQGYGPAEVAVAWKAGRFSGRDFAFQSDGTLCCPAHGMRNETHIWLKCLHRLFQCSRCFLERDQKYLCLMGIREH